MMKGLLYVGDLRVEFLIQLVNKKIGDIDV
jgi:hypothetical protein